MNPLHALEVVRQAERITYASPINTGTSAFETASRPSRVGVVAVTRVLDEAVKTRFEYKSV